jgi:predicted PurR-regulated permease PerM
LAAVYILYTVRAILPPFVLAGFMSYVLEPLVTLVQRRGVRRSNSILIVYAALLLAATVFILYFVPAFVRDVRGLAGQVPTLISVTQYYAVAARDVDDRYNLPAGLERGVVNALEQVEVILGRVGDNIFSYFLSSATILSYVVVAPVITYYILRDINRWRQRALVSLARHPLPYVDLLRDADQVLSGFVRGQAIVASSVAVMMWTGLAALGVKFTAALGLIAGLGEFIPFFGPFVAAVPVIILAFLKSSATGVWALALVAIIQWVDSNIIVPRVTGPRVGLHPLWMIFALFAGGELLGVWGLFIAVPVAGVLGALIKFGKAMYARA